MVQAGNDKSLNFRVAGFREDPLYPIILGVGTPSPTKVCLTVDRYHLPTLLSVPPTDFFPVPQVVGPPSYQRCQL